MAAHDTFEWFASTMMKNPTPEMLRMVKEARAVLLALRSEDERVRFVDETMQALRARGHHRA